MPIKARPKQTGKWTSYYHVTVAQVCKRLQISDSTLRRWVVQGHLSPSFRGPGHSIRFLRTDIEHFERNSIKKNSRLRVAV